MKWKSFISIALAAVFILPQTNANDPVWRWECVQGYCQKQRITPETRDTALSLASCRIFCSKFGAIWPQPTGKVSLGNYLVRVDTSSINVLGGKSNTPVYELFNAAAKRFRSQIESLGTPKAKSALGKSLTVYLNIADLDTSRPTLETDESYSLKVSETADGSINATITAPTYFGGRNGLETLGQLIIFDDIRGEMQIPRDVYIEDKPVYPYRGVLLDTSRSYISVDSIKRTIDAMASSKLNVFHWHITDSQSFPYVSKNYPELSRLGAYSSKQVYTPEHVADIIEFAKQRGVRVLPEFDAPAHVGEGWQDTDYLTCFNKHPWEAYCVEPPCGQLDPTKDGLYNVLEGIYKDMIEQFNPDMFHMGGDEVSLKCWNTTDHIVQWMKTEQGWGRTEKDFIKLWDIFQRKALERLDKHTGSKLPIIMWTSTLTKKEYVDKYLPKDRYIIQIWTKGDDPQIRDLLEKGYKLILSNYEALYLDCGFAGWVTDGNNWCSPYIGWQKVYENSPATIAGSHAHQILGAEATLWTEQVDDTSVDSRLWPRAAAMSERLWAEPSTTWRDAESRFLIHRERLVNRGINADLIEPQWCLQNEENCPMGGKFNLK